MTLERTVLVVSPTASLAAAFALSLGRLGCEVVVAKSFEQARAWWTAAPGLLITDLKLGAYNGLHLAVRAAMSHTPAIVIADSSFEHEIEQVGAVWMSPEAALTSELATVAGGLLESHIPNEGALWYGELPEGQPAIDTVVGQSSLQSD